MPLESRPLSPETWPAFARLVEKHHGIFGGCWCISFHLHEGEGKRGAAAYRAMKEDLVRRDRAHAAMIFDGEEAVGWCQFGRTDELPNIKSRKAYEEHLGRLPDWRITCFFIDRDRRHEGIANRALDEALREIGRQGGGTVEAYPETVAGRKVSGSFLWSGTTAMFERRGFRRDRPIGMHRWVVVRRISAGPPRPKGGRAARAARPPRPLSRSRTTARRAPE